MIGAGSLEKSPTNWGKYIKKGAINSAPNEKEIEKFLSAQK